ncbi:TetR/AcrR family transcriptional regulator [Roseimarinus sediminis]|jgi:AcrR family transcriptional regulator|uniref:TetR/AcrR family transcriptional regulator n=1 Tax=Roseimarinus sediminis TaxID=1610899 RepID=UPI003D25876A
MNSTREHILKVSLTLFFQKSYKEVTMKEIVEKTGLSKGAFYHYFNSKEDLFHEIVNIFFSLGAMDFTSFPQDSLKGFYEHYLAFKGESFKQLGHFMNTESDGNSNFNLMLLLFDALQRFPEYLAIEKAQYEKEVKVWEEVIETARQKGEINSEAANRQLADLFLYCTDGVFVRLANGTDFPDFETGLKQAFDTIYEGLKP